jgi:hypothetical protein
VEREPEEYPLLEAGVRERLEAGEDFVFPAVICGD